MIFKVPIRMFSDREVESPLVVSRAVDHAFDPGSRRNSHGTGSHGTDRLCEETWAIRGLTAAGFTRPL